MSLASSFVYTAGYYFIENSAGAEVISPPYLIY